MKDTYKEDNNLLFNKMIIIDLLVWSQLLSFMKNIILSLWFVYKIWFLFLSCKLEICCPLSSSVYSSSAYQVFLPLSLGRVVPSNPVSFLMTYKITNITYAFIFPYPTEVSRYTYTSRLVLYNMYVFWILNTMYVHD